MELMGDEGLDEDYKDEEEESFEGFEDQYVHKSKSNDPVSLRDWNSLTIAEFKIEPSNCGHKTYYGKKTELVSLLQDYDVEQFGAILEEEEDVEAAVASQYDSGSSDTDLDGPRSSAA
jgi:hypothetical protein